MKHQLILVIHGEPEKLIQVQQMLLLHADTVATETEIIKMELKRIEKGDVPK